MIYYFEKEKEKEIKAIPYKKKFDLIRKQLTLGEFEKICEELNKKIDGTEIQTSSWMPGKNWGGTPFDPIYHAVGKDELEAGKMFGLIVWYVFQQRPEVWYTGKFELNGEPIKGRTYFQPGS